MCIRDSATITLAECNNLSLRIKTAVAAAATRPIKLRIELTGITGYGTFTSSAVSYTHLAASM